MPGSRRRSAELLQAIYRATVAELAAHGVAGLTMDGIAQRAGASRTSLYRRWGSTEELAARALQELLVPAGEPEDSGELRGDLLTHFRAMARMAQTSPVAAAIGAVLGERGRHPELVATIQDRILQPSTTAIATIMDQAVRRGDIPAAAVTDELCAAGPALMVMHYLIHGDTPGGEEISRIVDHVVLPALTSDPAPQPPSGR